MLYKFKSKTAGDVIMLEANGRKILEIIGKDACPEGIILPEDMPAALTSLHEAIAQEESHDHNHNQNHGHGHGHDEDKSVGDALGLRQRAMPFIDMLQRNQSAKTEVVWGV